MRDPAYPGCDAGAALCARNKSSVDSGHPMSSSLIARRNEQNIAVPMLIHCLKLTQRLSWHLDRATVFLPLKRWKYCHIFFRGCWLES